MKIRVDLAAMAKSAFAKVLGEGGYDIVAAAGDGVLAITPNIINLYINAPDTMSSGRSKTYTMDAGSATLALQMNDAVTGTAVGRGVRSSAKPIARPGSCPRRSPIARRPHPCSKWVGPN